MFNFRFVSRNAPGLSRQLFGNYMYKHVFGLAKARGSSGEKSEIEHITVASWLI